MAGPWLYPISAAANRSFALAEGRQSVPVTVESYRALVESGRIVEDDAWYISQHWAAVEVGDELFIYTGDGDLGIIGYATVVGVEERGDRWCIRPHFDLGRCRTLLEHPVPAAVVRGWVFPRKSVTNLEPFQEQLRARLPWATRDPGTDSVLPEEVAEPAGLVEGAVRTITVNAYERSPEVRRECIAAHGTTCAACGMSFGAEYGSAADGFIHVHHLRPLSEVGASHTVDPVADLRPVCPNCHAVIHRRVPPYSVEEVRTFWQQRHAEPGAAADGGA